MIYLLRHGAVEGQGERRFIGQVDLPLGENGLRQARWWQMELAGILFDR
ncbi:MAG: histidine phosphatase family protein, partial [Deltaproteobacteria bacterium]|nr:histidine phosphatase family protein [Deltaproteobacteria bacterium]